MQQEVEALLALQQDDLKIREIEAQMRALDPQLAELDKRRDQAAAALARAETLVQGEEKKQRELQARLAQHKQMQERNLHQLEDVKRMREATAATTQVESTRRLMGEDEAELAIIGRRMAEMNTAIANSKQALAAVEQEQQETRPEIESKRSALQSQLDDAKTDRNGKAGAVSRANARQIRPHPRQKGPGALSVARWVVWALRHGSSSSTAQHDVRHRANRSV